MNIYFSTAVRRKFYAPHIISRWEMIPCLWLKRWARFPQAPQVEVSLRNREVRGTQCFLSQVECTAIGLSQKKARIPCSGLNLGSCFTSQDEGMTDSPVETLEKAVGLRLIWTGGIISLWHIERHTEFNASKGDDALLFLKMDRNPNITVPTRKWTLVSCFTSRCVRIVLLSVV